MDQVLALRDPLVADLEAREFRVGERATSMDASGDPLASYLSMIYAARGVRPGERIPLRDEDLDVLAGLVGDDAADVESRLIELMDCTAEEARSLRSILFGRRALAAAAGVAVGLAALGAAVGSFGAAAPTSTRTGSPSSVDPKMVQLAPAASVSHEAGVPVTLTPSAASTSSAPDHVFGDDFDVAPTDADDLTPGDSGSTLVVDLPPAPGSGVPDAPQPDAPPSAGADQEQGVIGDAPPGEPVDQPQPGADLGDGTGGQPDDGAVDPGGDGGTGGAGHGRGRGRANGNGNGHGRSEDPNPDHGNDGTAVDPGKGH